MTPDNSNHVAHHPQAVHLQSLERARSSSRHSTTRNGSSTAFEPATADENETIARNVSHMTDVESQLTATGRRQPSCLDHDPYGLSRGYKTESDLEQIKANTSRKRDSLPGRKTVSGEVGPKTKARKLQGFYKNQNAAIDRMLKSVEEHRDEARDQHGEDQVKFRIAVWGSFAANVALSGVQLYAAISSKSLSLFTTMADSIFDPLSNLTLILSARAIRHVDSRRFPAGKARLETVGNIVFCFLMIAVSLIIIAFACQELSRGVQEKEFKIAAVISVCCAFATKFVLFLYCWALKDKYSQINILWQDHRNDLFINGFGILTSCGGAKLKWWIDPMGAIILSVLISCIWLHTAFGEFLLIVGVTASVETQQLITYVCVTHDDAVVGIDTVRVYHSGPRLIAEVDIVMDPTQTLQESHDIAEALQTKLEDLPDIERAYVHIDYETTHKPEHAFKKDM
ncbi:related to cation diffusion facilitator 10 [Fusarium oxysporum]|uniref:Related to cation diffusion facilitator 10 n=1 Tax=Fusarium oxysporum TaxID=5507 RepID=A0A2H3SXL4_FUSOX|nr:related to cation diffusion facilitator 10 [Fusarium oxysporum]